MARAAAPPAAPPDAEKVAPAGSVPTAGQDGCPHAGGDHLFETALLRPKPKEGLIGLAVTGSASHHPYWTSQITEIPPPAQHDPNPTGPSGRNGRKAGIAGYGGSGW